LNGDDEMPSIRQRGRVNDSTTLIDIGMYGVAGVAAVYLINGRKKCLIDGGTRATSKRIIGSLRDMGAFPPDVVIATHSHYDHVQGIPTLRREAAKIGKSIKVLASEKAIPLLKDQSWNRVFGPGTYEGIDDVTPLKENDIVDLGNITLRIYEMPGHSDDQIAVMDESSKTIFVGDAVGDKIADGAFLPPFYPLSWNPDLFRASLDRIARLDYDSVCLAHFGCIYGDEARRLPDEANNVCETWWRLFDKYADKLGDAGFLRDAVLREIRPEVPDLKIQSPKLKALFALISAWRKLTGKPHLPVGALLLGEVLKNLSAGYTMSKEHREAGA
jgi:glyoxylase-like metal-dependent hydrolase (beta-lactamase superfamily II)